MDEVVCHADNLGRIACALGHALQAFDVLLVHSDDEVKLPEVVWPDRAGVVSETVAPAGGVRTHARVGQFAFVKIDEAGGIGDELVRAPAPVGQ